MKKTITLLLVLAFSVTACKKDQAKTDFEKKILGNWMVVDDNDQQLVTEWSFFYVASVKLYSDRSFKMNAGTGVDTGTGKHGTWILNQQSDSITFFTRLEDSGTIYLDTTKFQISLDAKDRLILKNSFLNIKHKRLSN